MTFTQQHTTRQLSQPSSTAPHRTQTHITSHILTHPSLAHHQDTYGDLPHTPKPSHAFRIMYSNINGISIANPDQESHNIGHTADAYQVDYLGLAETNVQWNNPAINDVIKKTLQKYWTQTIITVSYTHLTLPTIA